MAQLQESLRWFAKLLSTFLSYSECIYLLDKPAYGAEIFSTDFSQQEIVLG